MQYPYTVQINRELNTYKSLPITFIAHCMKLFNLGSLKATGS